MMFLIYIVLYIFLGSFIGYAFYLGRPKKCRNHPRCDCIGWAIGLGLMWPFGVFALAGMRLAELIAGRK